jgi:hypothetical protein
VPSRVSVRMNGNNSLCSLKGLRLQHLTVVVIVGGRGAGVGGLLSSRVDAGDAGRASAGVGACRTHLSTCAFWGWGKTALSGNGQQNNVGASFTKINK